VKARIVVLIAALALLIPSFNQLKGCATAQDVAAAQGLLGSTGDELDRQITAGEAQLVELSLSGDEKAVARLTKYLELLRAARDRNAQLASALQSAQNPDGSIDLAGGAGAAASLLPPPWNFITVSALGIGGVLAQEIRKRNLVNGAKDEASLLANDLKAVVRSIEGAKAESPRLKDAFDEAAPVIEARMGPQVRKRVADIRRD